MSESSMSHGRDCAAQEEKYPLNRLSPESFPSPTSQCVFAYRSYLRGLLPAAISLTGAVGEWADRLSGVSPTLDPIARLQWKLWRGKWARINDQVFAAIIREVGQVLRVRAGGREAIGWLDAHKCHFCKRTLAACRDYDISPVMKPARTT